MNTIVTKTIHYTTVNDLLDIVRKFDRQEVQTDELFARIERILRSSGWHMNTDKHIKPDIIIDRGL